mmetsp:Transcript_51988/g.130606  ORF Transcript_51988/g.130606 Transcript_51988/m.130606 type:complete len:308 (+) Transcript_51988:471-1394(+)
MAGGLDVPLSSAIEGQENQTECHHSHAHQHNVRRKHVAWVISERGWDELLEADVNHDAANETEQNGERTGRHGICQHHPRKQTSDGLGNATQHAPPECLALAAGGVVDGHTDGDPLGNVVNSDCHRHADSEDGVSEGGGERGDALREVVQGQGAPTEDAQVLQTKPVCIPLLLNGLLRGRVVLADVGDGLVVQIPALTVSLVLARPVDDAHSQSDGHRLRLARDALDARRIGFAGTSYGFLPAGGVGLSLVGLLLSVQDVGLHGAVPLEDSFYQSVQRGCYQHASKEAQRRVSVCRSLLVQCPELVS